MTKDVFIKEVRDAEAMLYHISKSILKNDSDCGDAVQETILNEKMEVTPLLWSLYLDYDEAMKVYEDEKTKFEYAGTDYGMDLYARTSIDQVRYKDGTVLTLDRTMGGIAGGGEKQDKENGVLIIRNSFPQLVDVDNLQAVHFGNIDQWLEVRG